MKKIIFAFIICIITTFVAKAQKPPLNKLQTLEYLNKEYSKIDTKYFKKISLDNKVLITERINDKYRVNLTNLTLVIGNYHDVGNRRDEFSINDSSGKIINYLIGFQLETDAIRIKKALEHLIALVNAEKSTDPFDK